MSRPRYVVQTVSGFRLSSGRPNTRAGLSAHVCDSVYLYEVVASYRSEDGAVGCGPGKRIGQDGALAAAEAHAERLNRDTA